MTNQNATRNRSATTHLSKRTLDLYETEGWATEELLKRVHIDGRIFECCVGNGKMAKVLDQHLTTQAQREVGLSARRIGQVDRRLITNDISIKHEADYHKDASDPLAWRDVFPAVDWIVTNPPFNVVHRILPLAHQHALTGVAMLLRLSYLEPCKKRWQWMVANLPHITLVTPRISFKRVERTDGAGNKKVSATDNITTAWLVWYKQRGMNQRLEIIPPIEVPDRNGNRKGQLLF